METKTMSVQQFAEMKNISFQAVNQAIKRKWAGAYPEIISIEENPFRKNSKIIRVKVV
jgi:predicted DNA-binding protein YlxM (UPF0122 family)